MNLLHIDSSILGANSVSREVAAAVVDRLRKADASVQVTYRDLAANPLPHVTPGELPSDHPLSAMAGPAAKNDGREASQAVLEEFLAAEVVVIGVPMYNFGIPSQLKAWVDRVLVPGRTFQYGQDGVRGLAGSKRVIVAISRGGFYGAGTPGAAAEHVETYLRSVFAFIGVTDPEIIIAEGVQRGQEQRNKAMDGALQAASSLRAA
jgi:FMN-dependent NADH-azoreductase